MLITLEGIDGTGKSSAAEMLAKELGFIFTSTPGADYSAIRNAAASNKYSAYHYYLSSCYYISDMAGKFNIVCDRYIHSTIAYNWPYSYSYPEDLYSCFEGLRRPEKSFLLCASDSVRLERMNSRKQKGGIISELDGDFQGQKRAQEVYMKFPELIKIEADGMSLHEVVKKLVHKVKYA